MFLFLQHYPNAKNPSADLDTLARETHQTAFFLRTGLLLLFPEESGERHTRNLHHLEAHTGDITDGVTLTPEPGDENLVVLVDEVKATIAGNEGGDLLAVLDELHAHALTNGRVGLLGLNAAVER